MVDDTISVRHSERNMFREIRPFVPANILETLEMDVFPLSQGLHCIVEEGYIKNCSD